MKLTSPKSLSGIVVIPRSLSFIAISVGGLALFLVIASRLLVSYPIVSTVLLGVDHSRKTALVFLNGNQTKVPSRQEPSQSSQHGMVIKEPSSETEVANNVASDHRLSSDEKQVGTGSTSISPNGTKSAELTRPYLGFLNDSSNVSSDIHDNHSAPSNSTLAVDLPPLAPSDTSGKVDSGSCDLYHGKWIYDPAGPLYTNNSCPIITQMQNCQGNGRPDKEYENWRWKPDQCNLPRFDARKFLELMRGKTLAYIGDSVGRNQMESMLCILWQVEAPKNRGNRQMQRWFFKSTSTSIVRIWSSWLIHKTSDPIQFAPKGVDKLHLDAPDEVLMEFLPKFDVLVLSSGHWFAKQSVYVLNNTIVGGQLWWPDKTRKMQVNNVEAFGISVETILSSIATHPNYTGLTIVRSYSPDHYEGGAWNTGGSCTGKTRPSSELVRNGFTDAMHEKQVMGFYRAVKKMRNGSKLRLMDITEAYGYRPDGHPGPYRSPDPNKVTKRGPHGEPPPQDCLHWCMPGPVDTWNEIVMEIIRREFEGP